MAKTESEGAAYTAEHAAAYPDDYLAGIDLYNAGEFHAAHDAWEARWVDEAGPREKLFLQAMISRRWRFIILRSGGAGRRGACT
jgi:predicted metal-dependent hydrolase